MYSRCLREDKPCAEIQLGWKAQDRTKYLLSNRDGNVVYFWHYTKSAAGSHHMHRSIHRPRYHSLPLGKKRKYFSLKRAKFYFYSAKPFIQEQEGFPSISSLENHFLNEVLASFSHQKEFDGNNIPPLTPWNISQTVWAQFLLSTNFSYI